MKNALRTLQIKAIFACLCLYNEKLDIEVIWYFRNWVRESMEPESIVEQKKIISQQRKNL